MLVVYEDEGQEFDSGETYYNSKGEEIILNKPHIFLDMVCGFDILYPTKQIDQSLITLGVYGDFATQGETL